MKALASQCIVLHHLAIYGPMPDIAAALAPGVVHWLDVYGRYAVQVFLVMGGFLAAGGLWRPAPLGPRLIRRARRLAPTLWAALALVLLVTAVIRFALGEAHTPSHTPAWPGAFALLANALMLQDILDIPALSAGVWYVAIDLQLYALLAVLLAVLRRFNALPWADATVIALTALSLGVINLDTSLEMWAPYFLGAYGLGVLAWRASTSPPVRRTLLGLSVLALTVLALALAWRDRVALAGAVALVLAFSSAPSAALAMNGSSGLGMRAALARWITPAVSRLGGISYSVFLVHYPVCLAMNALATYLPREPLLHAGLLLITWVLSLLAGSFLHRQVEARFSS